MITELTAIVTKSFIILDVAICHYVIPFHWNVVSEMPRFAYGFSCKDTSPATITSFVCRMLAIARFLSISVWMWPGRENVNSRRFWDERCLKMVDIQYSGLLMCYVSLKLLYLFCKFGNSFLELSHSDHQSFQPTKPSRVTFVTMLKTLWCAYFY